MKKVKHLSEDYKDSAEVVADVLLCFVAVCFFIALAYTDILEWLS